MDDQYDYIVEHDKNFFVGFKSNSHFSATPISYLFQNLRIVQITGGRAEWVIAGAPYLVENGDIIFFNNIASRRISNVIDPPFEYNLYALAPPFVHEDQRFLDLFYNKHKVNMIKRKTQVADECNKLLFQMNKEISNCGTMQFEIIQSLIRLLFFYCIRGTEIGVVENDDSENNNMKMAKVVADICAYIQNHIDADLGVSSLAQTVNFSRGYLSKVFKQYTGVTINEYINLRRIDNVCNLISEGNCNVLDAAFQSGFESSSGFYKTFTRIKGMPPRQFFVR